MMLAVNSLCKSYGNHKVLIDCSFSLRAGECLILRGPSGGGKSTLLRIMALLEQADSGSVLHGDKVWNASIPYTASAYPFLTVVFQQLFLWPNLTMAQNLSLVLNHRPDVQLSRIAMDAVERFAITHVLDRHPHECSLGERQRLAVARSLLSEAKFLLLDEPSSALDHVNRNVLVRELMVAMSRERGILVVTHDDQSFDGIAHQVLELENGLLTRNNGPLRRDNLL